LFRKDFDSSLKDAMVFVIGFAFGIDNKPPDTARFREKYE
jgi:hypothetical protein